MKAWVYDGQLRIAAELDVATDVIARFVYGTKANVPDYMVKYIVTGATATVDGVYRIVSDHLGSPRMVVDANNPTTRLMETRYSAFGVPTLINTGTLSAIPFGFAGGLYDADTGLVRFGARDYDPRFGRWTSKDPILFDGGQTNLYVYVGNDPVNRRDPVGLMGVALGVSGDVGFCWGLCVGSWTGGGGIYVGTDGIGVYATGQGSAGLGGHAGYGVQGSAYSSLSAFQGTSYGTFGVAGMGVVTSGSVMANPSGVVLSAGGGVGGGLWGGAAVSYTKTYGLSPQDIADAWGFLRKDVGNAWDSLTKPSAC
ncbi:MAG TPA: RHS repeat-associated core domain-containing protein, partial [Polyangiaceae bacterium]|nr:RHS repeat-associated core domain-containing protein [Polyangiaceae bacterium]